MLEKPLQAPDPPGEVAQFAVVPFPLVEQLDSLRTYQLLASAEFPRKKEAAAIAQTKVKRLFTTYLLSSVLCWAASYAGAMILVALVPAQLLPGTDFGQA